MSSEVSSFLFLHNNSSPAMQGKDMRLQISGSVYGVFPESKCLFRLSVLVRGCAQEDAGSQIQLPLGL